MDNKELLKFSLPVHVKFALGRNPAEMEAQAEAMQRIADTAGYDVAQVLLEWEGVWWVTAITFARRWDADA